MDTKERLKDSWQYAMGKLRAMWILLVILVICGVVLACLHIVSFLIGVGVGIILVSILIMVIRYRYHRHEEEEE
ncbi:MAG: hypothetical protein LIP03_01645 [Bacteroidales bacterium]|nr:hypothetical protein [Bacteroidales bacterium]